MAAVLWEVIVLFQGSILAEHLRSGRREEAAEGHDHRQGVRWLGFPVTRDANKFLKARTTTIWGTHTWEGKITGGCSCFLSFWNVDGRQVWFLLPPGKMKFLCQGAAKTGTLVPGRAVQVCRPDLLQIMARQVPVLPTAIWPGSSRTRRLRSGCQHPGHGFHVASGLVCRGNGALRAWRLPGWALLESGWCCSRAGNKADMKEGRPAKQKAGALPRRILKHCFHKKQGHW